jgi:hypothetical protein
MLDGVEFHVLVSCHWSDAPRNRVSSVFLSPLFRNPQQKNNTDKYTSYEEINDVPIACCTVKVEVKGYTTMKYLD